MNPSNFHTHTDFCDGKNTPEEIVKKAISLGCPAIGFSGHSYTHFDERYCMSKENTARYRSEVRRLKDKYADRIAVYLGIEQDIFSNESTDGYDYVIGSVHYIRQGNEYRAVDDDAETLVGAARDFFDGDMYALCEAYYRQIAEVYQKTKCQIIGHFDLITKFNETHHLFDETHPRYLAAAATALHTLLKAPVVFELNTGAMAQGYRTIPYPAPWIQKMIQADGKPLIFSSDCHDCENLLFGWQPSYHCYSEEAIKRNLS